MNIRQSSLRCRVIAIVACAVTCATLATAARAIDQAGSAPEAAAAASRGENQVAQGTQGQATLGSGCFWCTEAVFLRVKGVSTVVSGYAGGSVPNPTYQAVCTGMTGHAEVVQLTFDPAVISYAELLEIFWKTHDPTTLNRQGPDKGTQYRSVIFYHNDEQRRLAVESGKRLEARLGKKVHTEIRPFTGFYLAEDYHQKYFLRHVALLRLEYAGIYPDSMDFVSSTAVARVNGYLGGYGKSEDLWASLDRLGLSEEGKSVLARVGERLTH